MRYFLAFLLLGLLSAPGAVAQRRAPRRVPPPPYCNNRLTRKIGGVRYTECRRYRGQVAGAPLTLFLERTENLLDGRYFYDRTRQWLLLEAWCFRPGQPLFLLESKLDEMEAGFEPSGWWKMAQPLAPRLTGSWTDADSSRLHTFALTEDYTDAARCRLLARDHLGTTVCTYDSVDGVRRRRRPSLLVRYVQYHLPGEAATAPWHSLGPAPESRVVAWLDSCLRAPTGRCHSGSIIQDVRYNGQGLFDVSWYALVSPMGATYGPNLFSRQESGHYLVDLRTGRRLDFPDIFRPDARPALERLIARYLLEYLRTYDRRWGDVFTPSGHSGFTPAPPPPADWRMPLPASGFGLGPKGLELAFRPEEISPWRAGIPEIIIPYAELRPLLKPGSPLLRLLPH